MNVKQRKIGKAVLLPLFLMAITLVFISCPIPIANFGNLGQNNVPEGMGTLRVILGDALERTILPNTAATDFESFKLEFTGGTSTPDVTFTKAQLGTNITLPEGTYDILATAYLDANSSGRPVATFSATGVVISNSTATLVLDFRLTAPTGTDNGTFTWDITFPASTTQTMTIRNDTGATVQTPALTSGSAGSQLLQPGYYTVEINLTRTYNHLNINEGGAHTARFIQTHALHIFQHQTSHFAPSAITVNDYRAVPYTVTYNLNTGNIGGNTTALTQVYIPGGQTILPDVTGLVLTNYTFEGWVANQVTPGTADGHGTQLAASDLVLAATTWYARWDDAVGNITVNLVPDGTAITISDVTTTQGAFNQTITASVSGLPSGVTINAATWQWKVNGVAITNTGNTLLVDTRPGAPFYGIHQDPIVYDVEILVYTDETTPVPYSARVIVTVNP